MLRLLSGAYPYPCRETRSGVQPGEALPQGLAVWGHWESNIWDGSSPCLFGMARPRSWGPKNAGWSSSAGVKESRGYGWVQRRTAIEFGPGHVHRGPAWA